MTFHATNSEHQPEQVTVHVTSGPVEIKVAENYLHLRSFWHQLGEVLDRAEHETGRKLMEPAPHAPEHPSV